MPLDISTLRKYYETCRLGELSMSIPRRKRRIVDGSPLEMHIAVDLAQLYRHATGEHFFEYEVQPEDLEALVVFGSVLYRHFPPGKMPNDVDIAVITREGFTDEKIITPDEETFVGEYGNVKRIVPTAVRTRELRQGWLLFFSAPYMAEGALDLHLTYRSAEQLLNGLGHGDTVSESIVNYGVPIFGAQRFLALIREANWPREPLHQVEWREDRNGVLYGEIIPS